MSDFLTHTVLNSPYEAPTRHWKLDETGQPTNVTEDSRREAAYIIPLTRVKRAGNRNYEQQFLLLLKVENEQDCEKYYTWINRIRDAVTVWCSLPESQRGATPEAALLLSHRRTHDFLNQYPFFCQIEAMEVLKVYGRKAWE